LVEVTGGIGALLPDVEGVEQQERTADLVNPPGIQEEEAENRKEDKEKDIPDSRMRVRRFRKYWIQGTRTSARTTDILL
ncbi:MAG: hypothetical protein ACK5PJ_01815, partial [Ralstonia sp.]